MTFVPGLDRIGTPTLAAVTAGVLAGLLATVGCRQPNPDWQGPADGSATSTDPPTTTAADSTTSGDPPGSSGSTAGQACMDDADCPGGELCGPMGCQVGGEGDPCDNGNDCSDAARLCTNGACYDGSEGDPCNMNNDCGPDSSICGPNDSCQDGSPGDACVNNGDCMMGTSCMMDVCG